MITEAVSFLILITFSHARFMSVNRNSFIELEMPSVIVPDCEAPSMTVLVAMIFLTVMSQSLPITISDSWSRRARLGKLVLIAVPYLCSHVHCNRVRGCGAGAGTGGCR
jgi:hypothetical protein